MKPYRAVKRIVFAGVGLMLMWLASACGDAEVVLPAIPTPPEGYTITDPYATREPFGKNRSNVFPVRLDVPPGQGVEVAVSIRRSGDPATQDKVTLVVEGFVDAERGHFFDYTLRIKDSEGGVYDATPAVSLGLLNAGTKRKYAVRADIPSDVRIEELIWVPADGDISRQVTYHIDLAMATIPEFPDHPNGYEEAH
jgi:hypothetical protein